MATTRSRFLRLLWQRRKHEFTTTLASDGCEYVVPIPSRGSVQAPKIPRAYRESKS